MSGVTVGAYRADGPKSGRSHDAFPGAVTLPDGDLLMCWRGGPSHVGGTLGYVYTATSSDKGATWSEAKYVTGGSTDVRDPSLTISRDGETLWLSYFTYTGYGNYSPWVQRSDDGGETWGAAVSLAGGVQAIASPIVETESGRLIAALYGPMPTTPDSVSIAHSVDGGLTWLAGPIVAHGVCDARDYQEPVIVATPDGLVMTFRYGNSASIGVSRSADDGQTWSAPEPAFPGTGRPSTLYTSTGALVCVYRDVTTRAAMVRTSRDSGLTWGPARVLDSATVQFTYGAPVEVSPGVVAVPYALERLVVSGAYSSLHMRYLLDAPRVSPFGDTAAIRPTEAMERNRTVLAYDDFDRPDGLLSATPSGATWFTEGTLKIVEGVLRTDGAGVSRAYVTLGHGNHDVEADVMWTGNTGPAVTVRGVNASTYLMVALEGGGSALRLYKVEGGTVTLLSGVTEYTRSAQWNTLRVSAHDNLIRVYLDGQRVLTHVLAAADATTFAPEDARRSGVRLNAPSAGNHSAVRRLLITEG